MITYEAPGDDYIMKIIIGFIYHYASQLMPTGYNSSLSPHFTSSCSSLQNSPAVIRFDSFICSFVLLAILISFVSLTHHLSIPLTEIGLYIIASLI